MIRRLFKYNKWKSVKAGLGRLHIRYLITTRKINFYRRCFMSDNNVLRTVFISVLVNGCDEMLKSIFMYKASAVSLGSWMDVLHHMSTVRFEFIMYCLCLLT